MSVFTPFYAIFRKRLEPRDPNDVA